MLVLFTPWKRHVLYFSCFYEKHAFVVKISLRVRFWNERNTTRQISNWTKYNTSDLEINFFLHRQILNKIFSTCLNIYQVFFIFFKLKLLLSPFTYTFHFVLFHKTMYSYSLQYLRQLDNSTHRRSNNSSCTRFCKDLDFWFCYCVPFCSPYGLDICRNLLLLVKLLKSILQLLLSHTCLTSFCEKLWQNETR